MKKITLLFFLMFRLFTGMMFLNAQTLTTTKSLDVKALSNKWILNNGTVYDQVHSPIGYASKLKTNVNIISFTAVPTSIIAGEAATLIPMFENATSAFILDASYNVISNIVSGGAYTVIPSSTTTYELVVDGTGGERVTRTITVIVYNSQAQFLQQGSKLVATGNIGNAQLGSSVSISADGNTAIVGAKYDNNGAGAAWIYNRNGGVWTEGAKLVGSGAVTSTYGSGQGTGVAISGDGNTVIIGGWNDVGSWVFTRNGNSWTQQGDKLIPSGVPGFGFAGQGSSVALSYDGNTAIIGGPLNNSFSHGESGAWIWTRSGGVWSQQGPILVGAGSVGDAQQGSSVAISADGNTALVGGFRDNNDLGAAWVYTRTGVTWAQQGPKLVSTVETVPGHGFKGNQGYSVALSADGNTALIGANSDYGPIYPSNNTGSARIWTRSGGVWTQGTKLRGPGGASAATNQGFSVSLSADGNTAIVGGVEGFSQTSSALIWTRSGGVWTHQGTKLVGAEAIGSGNGQQPAVSISLSADGNTALVGGYGDNGGAGAVWVFTSVVASPPVTLISPGNSSSPGYTISTLNPSFFWNGITSASSYGLQLYKKNNNIYELIYNSDNITNTSIVLPTGTISENSQYYWQVRAKINNNWISYSSPYYFNVSITSLTPILSLSSSSIQSGGVISFSGINFSSNSEAKVIITSNNGYDTSITVNTNNIGYFTNSLNLTSAGTYTIYCKDLSTGNLSNSKSFEVKNVTNSIFTITDPYPGYQANIYERLLIGWKDKLENGASYPIVGSQRKYNYIIEKSTNNGTSWQAIETITGTDYIEITKTFYKEIIFTEASLNYLIRVRDGYMNNRVTPNVPLQVISSTTQTLSADFIWDYSFTTNSGKPIGAVADGTSRFYIKASDQSNTISQVIFSLFDDDNNIETRTLGKLMKATNISTYDEEANNANQLSISITQPQINNEFWCWYVAPDDYIGLNTSITNNTSREVKVKIKAEYSNGTNKEIIKKIIIKRPPVVLVHGLNSEPSMWNYFTNTPSFSKFVNYKLKIGGQDSYDNNAISILSTNFSSAYSIPAVIKDFRGSKIACNQVYYVGHSMGGIVLRYAETYYPNKFFHQENYNRGYINKFISLDTPHKGSPFANILESSLPVVKVLDISIGLDLASYYQIGLSGFINDIRPAIKDLRMNSYNINPTAYKSHVFIGDIIEGSETYWNISPYVFANININPKIRNIFRLLYYTNPLPMIMIMGELDFTFNNLSGNSISNSDLIVPLNSQLSNLPQSSNLATYTVNFHSEATGNPSIEMNSATEVATLFDEPISSSVWGSLPALQKSSSNSIAKSNFQNIVMDSNSINVLAPLNFDNLYVDSVFNVAFSLSDTTNLKKILIFYQDNFIEDTVKQTNYSYSLSVSNNFIDTQKVFISALYLSNDSAIVSSKSIPVIIKSNDNPIDIKSKLNFVYLQNDEDYYPVVNIYYEKFIGKIGTTGTELNVSVGNPEILLYNKTTKKMTAIGEGETSAVIEYRGLKDTVYFQINGENITGINEEDDNYIHSGIPNKFELFQNYPNPFNPTTTIKYIVPFLSKVSLKIYDLLGREIAKLVDEEQNSGSYEVHFNASRLASGIYFYRLQASGFVKTNKFVLIK